MSPYRPEPEGPPRVRLLTRWRVFLFLVGASVNAAAYVTLCRPNAHPVAWCFLLVFLSFVSGWFLMGWSYEFEKERVRYEWMTRVPSWEPRPNLGPYRT